MRSDHVSERRFWIQRLSKTSLRALHILGVVGAGGRNITRRRKTPVAELLVYCNVDRKHIDVLGSRTGLALAYSA